MTTLFTTTCKGCKKNIDVNVAFWNSPDAHYCATCAYVKSPSSATSADDDSEFDFLDEFEEGLINPDLWAEMEQSLSGPSCECGAVAAGILWHSEWCPIYVDPMKGKKESADSNR